ncbi:hypothetical protein [Mesorhizobium sp. B2-4-6]|uniref:hypothetical protein n=1 Tax=Mesorhizobium sp. B2-4-6 TaxID=2589943 RepID=UPI00112A81B3|nr:hypothetical protein [Mesorhizobium sp. B2-4-6]TPL32920.1 hypothetical protein FJ957_31560 [Mesorhizobium sp. B2-4-6]
MARPRINGPQRAANDPNYPDDCRQALEPHFQSLLMAAARAGWAPAEITRALLVMAADSYYAHAPEDDPLAFRIASERETGAVKAPLG